ncbi:PTS transporter subunit EIIC [Arthrobacter sp. HY1533]|uniref:PTS transporter subunit EIIC n=1 Tax=Arthrobacter sp. HY1533 TaxID=2970919 RepID=UPI0022B9F68E|nr:PTS transporter subunit EIIC [Arthrobacter sp. HY1533]
MTTTTLATAIVDAVGGPGNISSVTHCATRLRFNLVNSSIVNRADVDAIDGVMGSANRGGQYQVIIGPSVADLYPQVSQLAAAPLVEEPTVKPAEETKRGGVLTRGVNKAFDTLSGIFVMFIPVLVAAGMISALLSVLTTFNVVSTEDPTYVVLSGVQAAVFFSLPVFTGYAAGVKLRMNPFVGMALGAFLIFSTINAAEGLSIFTIPVPTVTYGSTVFPVILGVLLMSFIERGLKLIIPDILKGVVIPAVTLLVGAVATLLFLGPLGSFVGQYLAGGVTFLNENAGWVAPAIVATLFPLLILTGMHYALLPIALSSFAIAGFDPLLMVAGFLSNIAQGGAAAGSAILTRDKQLRGATFAMSFSSLCGISEPTLFGLTLRNKFLLLAVMAGGLAGGLFAGITSVKAFGFVGGLPSLPLFIDPSGGFTNLIYIAIAAAISFTVTISLTVLFTRRSARV